MKLIEKYFSLKRRGVSVGTQQKSISERRRCYGSRIMGNLQHARSGTSATDDVDDRAHGAS